MLQHVDDVQIKVDYLYTTGLYYKFIKCVIYQLQKSKEISESVRAVNCEWEDDSWCQAEQTEENTDESHPRRVISQPEFRPDI